jgi:uncharacterized protein (TIRG00374 family)
VEESGSTLQTLWKDVTVGGWFVATTAVAFGLMGLQFWLIPEALGQGITMQEAYVVLTASAMAGFASGLPLGLGATDAVMLSLLRAYGVDATEAGQIVILSRVLINLPTGIFGLAAYLIAIRQKSAEPTASAPARLGVATAGERE